MKIQQLYIRQHIPSKLLNSDLLIKGFFAEIRLRKKIWLHCSSHNLKKNLIANQLNCVGRNLDSQLGKYEHFILMGNFNVELNDSTMKNFCQSYLQNHSQRQDLFQKSQKPNLH